MQWKIVPLLGMIAAPLLAMAPAQMAPITQRAATADFRLELDIGPPEHMYSPAEAARLKPMGGEIMVSGQMVAMTQGGMSMSGNMQAQPAAGTSGWRHLELHVWSKAGGTVVKDAKVSIRVRNAATGKSETVPISVMYGIQAGTADWHYGNNVLMPSGHWQMDTTVNGEAASFDVTIPAA
jgi:hypothetical protein